MPEAGVLDIGVRYLLLAVAARSRTEELAKAAESLGRRADENHTEFPTEFLGNGLEGVRNAVGLLGRLRGDGTDHSSESHSDGKGCGYQKLTHG